MNSNRRELLRLFLTCGLLLRSPFRLGSLAELPMQDTLEEDIASLLQLLSHRESVEEIGATYLQAHEDMATSRALMRSIESKVHQRGWTGADSLDRGRVAERLREAIREDFSKARTVTIGGWLLSETEVQLCGLYTVGTRAGIL
ncbi:MAG: hypothetical protein WBG00_13500 [Thermoanaerobaculia bacterium]